VALSLGSVRLLAAAAPPHREAFSCILRAKKTSFPEAEWFSWSMV
jgi:hypothetical protein